MRNDRALCPTSRSVIPHTSFPIPVNSSLKIGHSAPFTFQPATSGTTFVSFKNKSGNNMYAASNSSYTQLSDEKLITMIAMNHQQAYTVLVRRYERLVQSVLSRYLSDPEAVKEVMQDTFLRAFRALPDFQGRSKFSTWLYKIAVSLAVNRLRIKRYMSWQSLEDAPVKAVDAYSDFTTSFEKQETYSQLQDAIRQLSQQDAVALELFYLHEHSVEEIGQMTGWTSSNIKSRLSRARVRLRHVMEREGIS